MRFAIAVLACALAVADAQFNRYNVGQYQQGQYQQGQYQQGQYRPYQPAKTYKPFVNPPTFPGRYTPVKAVASVAVTPAPLSPVVPIVPVVPVKTVVPVSVPIVKVASDARSAETLKYGNEVLPDGSYAYFFETNNGIAAQAQGTPRNLGGNPPAIPDVVQGSFSWVSPEGKNIAVTYVADENGYQPQSDALPVPPPLPAQIARALDYIARSAKN